MRTLAKTLEHLAVVAMGCAVAYFLATSVAAGVSSAFERQAALIEAAGH